MRAVGIDFGTSHTVAVVAVDDAPPRPLLFDGSPLLPSAVFLDESGRLVAGSDAVRAARLDPARFEPNPKRRVDEGSVLLGTRTVPVSSLVGAVLTRVAEEARRWAGEAYSVVLTHPAGWSAQRRSVLVDAASLAGLPDNPTLLPEPVAAARYFTAVLRASVPEGAALAVYDLGAGTFDAAVVRRSPAGFEVLSASGLPDVGGLDLDQALVEHLGEGYSSSRTAVWNGLLTPADTAARRQRALLYDDVRGMKEALSRTSSADVHLPVLEVAAHVTRDELERLSRPMLARTVDCLARTIADARLSEDELVGIFLVGGSSRMPLVARLIHQELGIAPTALEQPETVVAQGAVSADAAPRVPAQRGPGGFGPASDWPVSPSAGPTAPGYPVHGPGGVGPASDWPVSPTAGPGAPGYPMPGQHGPSGVGPGSDWPVSPTAGPTGHGSPMPGPTGHGSAMPGQQVPGGVVPASDWPVSPTAGPTTPGYAVPGQRASSESLSGQDAADLTVPVGPAPSYVGPGQAVGYPAPASPATGYSGDPAAPGHPRAAPRLTSGRAGLAWVVTLSALVAIATTVLVVLLANG